MAKKSPQTRLADAREKISAIAGALVGGVVDEAMPIIRGSTMAARKVGAVPLEKLESGEAILAAPPDVQLAILAHSLETCCAPGEESAYAHRLLQKALLVLPLPWTGPHLALLAEGLRKIVERSRLTDWAISVLNALESLAAKEPLPPEATASLAAAETRLLGSTEPKIQGLAVRVAALRSGGASAIPLVAEKARVSGGSPETAPFAGPQWVDLLQHCATASAATPTAKWLRRAEELLPEASRPEFRDQAIAWFVAFEQSRPSEPRDWGRALHNHETLVLKGLGWCCGLIADDELARGVGRLALAAYKKVPGIGPRAVSVGNAAVYALAQMSGEVPLGQLAMLKIKVKAGNAQKGIEKALTAAAVRLDVPREEIEEMGVPAYGLTDVGRLEETFGEFTAELTVDGRGKSELVWRKTGGTGKPQKSIPAAVTADFPEEIKDLKAAIKDLEKMVPAQRDRLDNLFLERKAWPIAVWRERYLDHPVVGILARRLIWRFTCGNGKSACDGIWHDGRIVNVDDQKVARLDEPEVTVELWHPVGRPMDDVLAWRGWLERHEVRQPFKQAHRELYLLTDAERRTNTYSNRYAAHILRQHQFHALCGVRNWKNKLRLMVDDIYTPPTKFLPQWGLRAEFWIEGIGDRYGTDTTDSGSFLYLATDQVRFYRIQADRRYAHAFGGGYEIHGEENPANEPLPLDLVPPLVLSEILRDVDLFVGVCSVGNDPTWGDGGPEGRYATYWTDYSFGDLSVTARTRKEVLERLVPRLKIASRCSFDDKFLKVRGDLRTYKIHLGSGNILMEPNDQYLCIVPDSKMEKGSDGMFLPFEGDRTLSIILSKAMLLAADTKIADTTITRQIQG